MSYKFKSQIQNYKLQINYNVKNTKLQIFLDFDNCYFEFICYLRF